MKRIPALSFCCVLALAALLLPGTGGVAVASCSLTCSQMKSICQQQCFTRGCAFGSFTCNTADPCTSTCRCANCQP
jgi:hypothetical protein